MKRINRDFLFILLLVFAIVLPASVRSAMGRKDAQVTQVIHDVRLLSASSAGRAASVNDRVAAGQAVRTGGDSRAELTFTDQSITRLGANSIFTYGDGAKELNLSSGAALIVVPKAAGQVTVNTAAATAAISGFTALVETHPKGINKWMILEGDACVKKKNSKDPCVSLHSGDMLILQPGMRGHVQKFDIQKTLKTGLLFKNFNKLPDWAMKDILNAVDDQANGAGNSSSGPGSGGNKDQTGVDKVDQKNNADRPPSQPNIPPPPGSPPPSFRSKPHR